jgi:guanylate kinase
VAEFEKRKKADFFLEWAQVYDNYYGTAQQEVDQLLQQGKDVILSVDVQGARTVRSKVPCVLIFLAPPSMETLKTRLVGRGTDSPEVTGRRLEEAEREMAQSGFYDYTVVNDTLEHSIQNVFNLIQIERSKRS